eukprot:1428718-Amphidinium_carterae.1
MKIASLSITHAMGACRILWMQCDCLFDVLFSRIHCIALAESSGAWSIGAPTSTRSCVIHIRLFAHHVDALHCVAPTAIALAVCRTRLTNRRRLLLEDGSQMRYQPLVKFVWMRMDTTLSTSSTSWARTLFVAAFAVESCLPVLCRLTRTACPGKPQKRDRLFCLALWLH